MVTLPSNSDENIRTAPLLSLIKEYMSELYFLNISLYLIILEDTVLYLILNLKLITLISKTMVLRRQLLCVY